MNATLAAKSEYNRIIVQPRAATEAFQLAVDPLAYRCLFWRVASVHRAPCLLGSALRVHEWVKWLSVALLMLRVFIAGLDWKLKADHSPIIK